MDGKLREKEVAVECLEGLSSPCELATEQERVMYDKDTNAITNDECSTLICDIALS